MSRYLLEAFLQVVILIPFSLFFIKALTKGNLLRILFFALIFIVYQIMLILPKLAQVFNFIGGNWNWDGKIFGILFGMICYFVFRKFFSENDFFTFRQEKKNFKKTLIVAISSVLLVTLIASFTGSSEFDGETLAFQITMPGIDEEIMFCGILLGLLATALKEKINFLGNPAVLLTSVLFGFIHAFTLDKNFSLGFEPI
ncbi:MAG TPA: hypothetical protein PKY59_24340, partial [Pyrinomonadaceae bacterium]|nr:hypothetical protein [Pyrinomonadaceae bacterium]